jgi:HNH endonuclease
MCPNVHLCPYCDVNPRASDDHIFPEFLGGKTTIRACKPCNDRFGHEFEGPVSKELAPIVVNLSQSGLPSPRRVVWRRALKRDGFDCDMDSDLNITRSRPEIERDEPGAIKRAMFSVRDATRFKREQESQGKKVAMRIDTIKIKTADMPRSNYDLPLGTEIRRLAIKLAIATADHMGTSNGLTDQETREILLNNTVNTRVRLDLAIHEELEKMRPPLSHFVYVKGNGSTHKSYAVVQFYGIIQMFVLLNDGAFTQSDFAGMASLDIKQGYVERFGQTDLFMIPEAPIEIGYWKLQQLKLNWMKKINAELKAAFGGDDNILLNLR